MNPAIFTGCPRVLGSKVSGSMSTPITSFETIYGLKEPPVMPHPFAPVYFQNQSFTGAIGKNYGTVKKIGNF